MVSKTKQFSFSTPPLQRELRSTMCIKLQSSYLHRPKKIVLHFQRMHNVLASIELGWLAGCICSCGSAQNSQNSLFRARFWPNKQCLVLEVDHKRLSNLEMATIGLLYKHTVAVFFFVFSFISWRSRCHKPSCVITPCATSGFHYVDVAFPAQHGPLVTRGGAKIVPGTRHHHLMAKLKKIEWSWVGACGKAL